MKDELNDLLDGYEAMLTREKRAKDSDVSKYKKALDSYLEVKKTVICPVFVEFEKPLKERNHDSKITEWDGIWSPSNDSRNDPFIGLAVYPLPYERHEFNDTNTPAIHFYAKIQEDKIWVHVCDMMPKRGGSSGSIGKEYPTDKICQNDVRQEVLSFMKKIFA
jgi:hypothetical protein